jgi:hypothetical protein
MVVLNFKEEREAKNVRGGEKADTPTWGDVKSDLVPRPIHNRATVDLAMSGFVWLAFITGMHEQQRHGSGRLATTL